VNYDQGKNWQLVISAKKGNFSYGHQQGCQIFLGTNIPKREKYTKLPQTIPNGSNIFQMVIKYDIFLSKALQILPKLRFWV
jgi:hypothetical protein